MRIDSDQIKDAARNIAIVAGVLAIVLAPALLLIGTPIDEIQVREFTVVAIDFVLGIVLIISARLMEKNLLTSVVLGFVASLPLLVLGGNAGLIGGLFGLASAILGAIPLTMDILK